MNQEMDMPRKKMEMEMEMPIRYTYYLARTYLRTRAKLADVPYYQRESP